MARKQPANSVAAAVKAAVNAAKPPHEPPAHARLRACDMPFWEAIMTSRARDEWAPADLIVAAQLARLQADIERESAALESEGAVIDNFRGTPIANPRHSVLEALSRRQLAMMRCLAMQSTAARGVATLKKDRVAERQARDVANEVAEDELLA